MLAGISEGTLLYVLYYRPVSVRAEGDLNRTNVLNPVSVLTCPTFHFQTNSNSIYSAYVGLLH